MKKYYKSFLHHLFRATILIKGIDGILDIITSLILLFSSSNTFLRIIPTLLRKELIEDPNDIIGNYLMMVSQNLLPDTQLFIVIYLAVHGFIKIGLALALNGKNYRAYKVSEMILIIFVCYQLYRFSHTQSIVLLLFTLLDILIVFLINLESKKLSRTST